MPLRGCALLLEGALDLAPCDAAPDLADLVDQVHAVRRLWVLGADVEVEMAAEAARGEGLAAEGAGLVLGRLEGEGAGTGAGVLVRGGRVARGSLRFGHGHAGARAGGQREQKERRAAKA